MEEADQTTHITTGNEEHVVVGDWTAADDVVFEISGDLPKRIFQGTDHPPGKLTVCLNEDIKEVGLQGFPSVGGPRVIIDARKAVEVAVPIVPTRQLELIGGQRR
jgi:hypothetical protein